MRAADGSSSCGRSPFDSGHTEPDDSAFDQLTKQRKSGSAIESLCSAKSRERRGPSENTPSRNLHRAMDEARSPSVKKGRQGNPTVRARLVDSPI